MVNMVFMRQISICVLTLLLTSDWARGQGFPNVTQTPGDLLTPLLAPNQGRTAVIAYHNGWLYTVPEMPASQPNSDFLVRRWDMSDLSNVTVAETYNETEHPVMAHGYLKIGDYLALGDNWPQEQPFSFRAVSPNVNQRAIAPGLQGPYDRGDLFQPWHINTYWSYNPDEIDDLAVLSKDGTTLATWDHIGETGVIGHPFIIGNLLIFASDQSRTGVATYDISDPANPRLLDVLKTGGPGGYWPELWGNDGNLYVVFPYREPVPGMRVVDVTDPENMEFIADVSLPGVQAMYVQFQDEFAFLGSHKVDMRTQQSVLRFDTEGENVDTSQFALPVGNLLATGGMDQNQGLAIWAHQAEPDTRGPSVGYHRPTAGQTNYPTGAVISVLIHETLESPTITVGENFIVRPMGGDPISGKAVFAFNDILTFTPDTELLPDTTYEVVIPPGGIKDVAGNGIEGYSFTFSTGGEISGNLPPEIMNFSASGYPAEPGETITFSAQADDPEDEPLEYRFDFGEGSSYTGWSSTASATFSYEEVGHYTTKVQVRDASGVSDTAVLTITVTDRTAAAPPGRSSEVVLDETRRTIWTVNPDNDTITAIHADTLEKKFERSVGDHPVSVAVDGSGTAWVACRDGDRIDRVGSDGTPLPPIALNYGDAPAGILVTRAGNVFISLNGPGELIRINSETGTTDRRVAVGPTPRALALSPDESTIYVARFVSAANYGEVRALDTVSMNLSRVIRLDKLGGEAHRDGSAEGKGVPNYLAGMAVNHDGDRLFVVSAKMNTDRGTLTGADLDQDNTVRNLLTIIDTGTGEVTQSIDIDNSESASAVCFSPLGDYFFVTLQGNNDLSVFDTFSLATSSGLGGFLSRQRIGSAPRGLCIDPVTDRLFVKNFLSRDITVVELEGFTARGRADFPKQNISTVETEVLPEEILRGKQIFYHASDPRMSGEGYMSCATCHVDGGHDGRTWDFTGRGEGLRNTTTLLGKGGTAQGNLHWSANFDELQDFEHDIRGAFGGSGFLTDTQFANANTPGGTPKAGLDDDLDALAAYVASLGHETVPKSPFRETNGELTTTAGAGAAIFEREGCATCHSGNEMTDGILHDIGTLRDTSGGRLGGVLPGIETPTLRGLWKGAPYLHDGTAKTIESVFTAAGGYTLQAENAATIGNASIEIEWTEYNNDASVRNGGLAQVWEGGRLRFTNVDGGPGGTGAVEVRFSSGYSDGTLVVRVNGTDYSTTVSPTGNVPDWRYVNWDTRRVEGVQFQPGTANTIEIFVSDPEWLPVAIDEITITTSDVIGRTAPHRRVTHLSLVEQEELYTFLRQLDGSEIELSGTDLPPPSPTGIQVSRIDTGARLQWNPSPGATHYRIYRASTGDFESATFLGHSETNSFIDRSIASEETGFYWIASSNETGETASTSPVQISGISPLPDIMLGRNRSSQIGDNIYRGRQKYTRRIRIRKKSRAMFAVQNDTGRDRPQVTASKGKRRLKVRYYLKSGGRRNITSSVTRRSFALDSMSPGDTRWFQIEVRAKSRARRKSLRIRVRSGSNPTLSDRAVYRVVPR